MNKNPGKVVTRYQFSEIFARAWTKGMSMKNVMGGFKTTGVFPLNREAIMSKTLQPEPLESLESLDTLDTPSLPKETGIKFLPLHSPFPSQKRKSKYRLPIDEVTVSTGVSGDSLKFTAQELALFERRYEEGYDIVSDSKYNAWFQKFHCKELKDSSDGKEDSSYGKYKDTESDTVA